MIVFLFFCFMATTQTYNCVIWSSFVPLFLSSWSISLLLFSCFVFYFSFSSCRLLFLSCCSVGMECLIPPFIPPSYVGTVYKSVSLCIVINIYKSCKPLDMIHSIISFLFSLSLFSLSLWVVYVVTRVFLCIYIWLFYHRRFVCVHCVDILIISLSLLQSLLSMDHHRLPLLRLFLNTFDCPFMCWALAHRVQKNKNRLH